MAKDEILVVGAGPVGLMMAAELARHGVKCRIIDKNTSQNLDSRAVGTHARTLEIYENVGIIDQALEKGVKVIGLNLYSHGKKLVHTTFSQLDSRYNFILDLPQNLTESILIAHLKNFGIEVERNVTLTHLEEHEDHVRVTLKYGQHSLTPATFAYIIGCDGARSICRHLCQISFPGDEYPSRWAVLDSALEWPFNSQELQLFLHEKGLTAFFPLPSNRMRITYEILLADGQSDIPEITYETALEILHDRVSKELKLIDPKDLRTFIIHHRQAVKYQKERVFLTGDAAHLHSPAGGQGMNTGIQDAYNLAWKLALVCKGLSPKTLLKTYHLERYPIGKWVLNITDRITRMMTVKNSVLSFLRDTFLTAIDHINIIKKQLPKRFSQLYIQYEHNAIIYEACLEHHPLHVRAGHRAPDHEVKTFELDKKIRLFKLFQGIHHTLLLFSGKNPHSNDFITLNEINTFIQKHTPLFQTYLLIRNEEDLKLCSDYKRCFLDQELSVHTHYGIEKTTALIVRPDGVVGFVNQPPSTQEIEEYRQTLFKH